MLFYLFLLFTLTSIVELAILVRIGQATTWWAPVVLVIATGIVGAALARWQGFQALQRIREESRAGRIPAAALIDGFLIVVAGLLLIAPGVLSDVLGIALLIPPIRSLFKRGVVAWLKRNVEVRVGGAAAAAFDAINADGRAPHGTNHDEIIDVTVTDTRVEDAQ